MVSNTQKRYVLVILTTVYTLSFMDRIMIGLLMQPIKEELLLSDTQLGFLTGIAFALFYAMLGIPIARWADRGNRSTIIALAMVLWGGMVMLCGLVTSFLQMVLVRVGAAVGEAGCMPPAYSLIGDYFLVSERTRAMSIFMAGIPISILISFLLAGWINEYYGWRVAFLTIGIPGLLMGILVKITLHEPRLCSVDKTFSTQSQKPFCEIFITLWQQNTYRNLVIALALVNFVGIGIGQWFATFFIRNHGMETGELGVWMGLTGGIGGVVGILSGGYLIDRYMAKDAVQQLNVISYAISLLFLVNLSMLFLPYKYLSLLQLIPFNFLALFFYGPIMVLLQQLVAYEIRAMSIAITLLVLNLIGMGIGPQIVGILSDLLTHLLGSAQALKVAMAIASVASLGAAHYFRMAAKTINVDIRACDLKSEST